MVERLPCLSRQRTTVDSIGNTKSVDPSHLVQINTGVLGYSVLYEAMPRVLLSRRTILRSVSGFDTGLRIIKLPVTSIMVLIDIRETYHSMIPAPRTNVYVTDGASYTLQGTPHPEEANTTMLPIGFGENILRGRTMSSRFACHSWCRQQTKSKSLSGFASIRYDNR